MGPSSIKFLPTTLRPTPKPTSITLPPTSTKPPTHSPTPKPTPSPTLLPGIIEGLVYFDASGNGDGFDQVTDFGVYNVPLWLFSCNSTHLYNLLNKTTTSTRGRYSFDDLIPGQYYVYTEPPSYYRLSEKWNGDTNLNGDLISPGADSSINPESGDTVCLDLSGGEIMEQNVALWYQNPTPATNPPKTQPYSTAAPSKSPISTKPTPSPNTSSPTPRMKGPTPTPTSRPNNPPPTPRPNLFMESRSPTLPQPTTNIPTMNPDGKIFLPTTSKPSPPPSTSEPTSEPTLHPAWNFFVPTTNKPTSAPENKPSLQPILQPGDTVTNSPTTMPNKQPTSKPFSDPIVPNSVSKGESSGSSSLLKLHCIPVLASVTAFVWSFYNC
mmetsp:Transcript_37271/g.76055  ORF Transcript_37271/g.76055 Transcript_37271/m.76055 type:complete len:381 (-) Transcript_37271:70-1212(-)